MRGAVIPHRRICGIERYSSIARQGIRADNLQRESGMLGIIRGPPCCLIAGMRPVNTDENGLVVNHDDLLEVIAICNIAYFQQYPATLGFAGKLSRKRTTRNFAGHVSLCRGILLPTPYSAGKNAKSAPRGTRFIRAMRATERGEWSIRRRTRKCWSPAFPSQETMRS